MATKPYETTSAAGSIISLVGGNPTTFDDAGFGALTWVPIGKIKNAGELGKVFEIIKNNYLSQRGTEKRKGTFDAGALSIDVDVKTDAGQALCKTALDSDEEYNIKIAIKTGLVFYLRGLVTGFRRKIGAPNDMFSATITIELNPFMSGAVEVDAIMVEPTV